VQGRQLQLVRAQEPGCEVGGEAGRQRDGRYLRHRCRHLGARHFTDGQLVVHLAAQLQHMPGKVGGANVARGEVQGGIAQTNQADI